MSNKTQPKEKDLAEAAGKALAVEEAGPPEFREGHPLPEGFDNPDAGKAGHRCVDPQGNYQPSWTSIHIHRSGEDMPERQFFQAGSQHWRVRTGMWVDVPPLIVSILSCTIVEDIDMSLREAGPLTDNGVTRVVNERPRFSTSMMPSA